MSIDPSVLQQRKHTEDAIAISAAVIRRAQWGAKTPRKPLELDWDYDSIVVHYTGHENLNTPAAIQSYDLEHKHWDDISYHYAISMQGQRYEGRELIYKGSHVRHQNTGKIGIVCMGDFDESLLNPLWGRSISGDDVAPVMLNALKSLTILLRSRFPIHFFGGHIEYGDTDVCPGSKLLPIVQKMRQQMGFQAPQKRSL